MGDLVNFPSRDEHDPLLTYPQLALHFMVSERFLRERRREGMQDAGMDLKGRRVFRLSVVTEFLEERQKAMGRNGDAA